MASMDAFLQEIKKIVRKHKKILNEKNAKKHIVQRKFSVKKKGSVTN